MNLNYFDLRKNRTFLFLILFSILFTFSLVFINALDVDSSSGSGVRGIYLIPKHEANYSSVYVNDSLYHQGLTPQQVANLYVEADDLQSVMGRGASTTLPLEFTGGSNITIIHGSTGDKISIGANVVAEGWDATAIGNDVSTGGYDNTAIGAFAGTYGDYASAFGSACRISGVGSTGVGAGSNIAGASSTLVGYDSDISKDYAVVLGSGIVNDGLGSIIIGRGSYNYPDDDYGIVIGYASSIQGADYSTAIGYTATANKDNQIILSTSDGAGGNKTQLDISDGIANFQDNNITTSTYFIGNGSQLTGILTTEADTLQSVTTRGAITNMSTTINNSLYVTSTLASNLVSERRTTQTAGVYTSVVVRHKTNQTTLSNGFGSGFVFQIENGTGSQLSMGLISGSRDGADNSGQLQLATTNAGAYVSALTLRADGRATLVNNLTGTNSNMTGECLSNTFKIQGGGFSVASTGWTSATGFYVTNTNNPIYTTSTPTAGSVNIEARYAGGWINIKPTATGKVNISNAVASSINLSSARSYNGFAVCYAVGDVLGHCTDAVNATGGCTCVAN